MTEAELTEIEDALRAEHHSEHRWTHTTTGKLLAEVRYLREHLDNAEGDRDRALERVALLEDALRKVVKHQPWPGDDRSERDFDIAAALLSAEQ